MLHVPHTRASESQCVVFFCRRGCGSLPTDRSRGHVLFTAALAYRSSSLQLPRGLSLLFESSTLSWGWVLFCVAFMFSFAFSFLLFFLSRSLSCSLLTKASHVQASEGLYFMFVFPPSTRTWLVITLWSANTWFDDTSNYSTHRKYEFKPLGSAHSPRGRRSACT